MKHLLITVAIIVALLLLIFVGALLYKHFFTDQIRDKDGMVNPNYVNELDVAPTADSTKKEVTQLPATTQEPEAPDTKAAIDFTQMEAQEAFEAMVEFMADPTAVAGTPVKLCGTVTSMEFEGGRKWYSVMLPGEGGYEEGPHFIVEGFKDEDYPSTMTTVEISGIFDVLEGAEDPTFDDYYVMVKPEDYVNVNAALASAVFVPDEIVSATDTLVFEVDGVKLTYMGKSGDNILFHAENGSSKKVTLSSIEVMFNEISVMDSFWISLQAGETADTDITAFPITLEEAGIAKLETVSFKVEMINEDDAELQSGVVTIRLLE